jgi:hypothetical protein
VFVEEVHGRAIDDLGAYDLCVSTGELGVDGAAAVVIAAYRYRFGDEVMRALRA